MIDRWTARIFDAGAADRVVGSYAPVTATPCTISAWFLPTNQGLGSQEIVAVDVFTGSATEGFRLNMNGSTSVRAISSTTGTNAIAASATAAIAGTWNHAAAIFISTASRSISLNGAAPVNTAGTIATGAFNTIDIGRYRDGTGSSINLFTGRIAGVCLWRSALSQSEIYALSRGLPPWLVRPGDVVSCPDLETLYDQYARAYLTPTGSSITGAPFFNDPYPLLMPYVGSATTGVKFRRTLYNRTGSRGAA